MTDQANLPRTSQSKGAIYMSIATISWGLYPLGISLSNAGDNLLAFTVIVTLTSSMSLIMYLLIFKRRYLNRSEWSNFIDIIKAKHDIESNSRFTGFWNKHLLLAVVIGRCGDYIFAWGTRYIDTAVATVIFETWIIWYIIMHLLDKNDWPATTLKKGLLPTFVFIFFAFLGVTFVVFSQEGIIDITINIGIIITLSGAVINAANTDRSIKFGEIASKNYSEKNLKANDSEERRLVYTLLIIATANIIVGSSTSAIMIAQSIFARNKLIPNISMIELYWSMATGFIVIGFTVLFLRKALVAAVSQEVLSIHYFAPFLALIFLSVFTTIAIARLDWFIIGSGIILTVNLFLNTESLEKNLGLSWFAISIWVTGVVVLFRDSWLGNWLNNEWLWSGSTDYFALLGLSTTVFILIFSFRTLRTVDRIRQEEQSAFSVYWKIRLLKGKNAKELKSIIEIDKSKSSEQLHEIEKDLLLSLEKPIEGTGKIDQAMVLGELDMLVHSKTKGRDIIEPIVLISFSLLTIFITLVSRPQFQTWNSMVIDSFTILFTATIAYLTINIFDLRRERSDAVLERKYSTSNSQSSDNPIQTKWNRWSTYIMPVILCSIMYGIFIFLVSGKWLSDWTWACELFPSSNLPEQCS